MPATTIAMAKVLVAHLGLSVGAKVLDYGCAKGYVVKALRKLEIDACGVDVSAYAVGKCDRETRPHVFWIDYKPGATKSLASSDYIWSETQHPFVANPASPFGTFCRTNTNGKFDCVISKDVLEHIPYEKLDGVLSELREISDMLFIAVPLGQDGKYVVPEYELDVTHIIRENKEWWEQKIAAAGFTQINGTYRLPGIKDNWAHYEQGNLFITAR
jgi:predicted TPR repeat methyltransferase